MPQFSPGEVKKARAPITVKPSGLSCSVELYLVSNGAKVATSGVKPFTSTGAKQDVSLPITMPGEGTYPVYLDIFTNGLLIGAYQATEDVTVEAEAPFEFSNVSAFKTVFTDATSWSTIVFSCTITNPGSSAQDRLVKLWRRYRYRDGQERTLLYRTLEIFLNAGSSINFVWDGNTYDVENRKFNGPLIPSGGSVCMWLDDSGNLSQEGCA